VFSWAVAAKVDSPRLRVIKGMMVFMSVSFRFVAKVLSARVTANGIASGVPLRRWSIPTFMTQTYHREP
jgi:hypothetical protein